MQPALSYSAGLRSTTATVPAGRLIKRRVELRRIIILVTLLIAGLIVGTPYIVGQVAEARQVRLVEHFAGDAGQGVLLTEEYQAGWFTSTARHRYLLGGPTDWAMVIETRLAHGPWPGLDGSPGLVRMLSTMRLENGVDAFDIPGQIFTFIALDGSGVTNFDGQAMEQVVARWPGFLRWDGGTLTLRFDSGFENLDWTVRSKSLHAAAGAGEYQLRAASFKGAARVTDHGLWAGNSFLTLDGFMISDTGSGRYDAAELRVETQVESLDDRVDHSVTIAIAGLDSPRLSDATFDFSAIARNLDASALARLIEGQSSGAALNDPVHFDELFRAGSELRVDRLALRAAQGDVDARLDLALTPPPDPVQEDQTALMRSATGNADLTISPGILSVVAGSVPQGADLAATLVALGYLRESDGDYVAEVRYRSGMLTINGLPLMIPGSFPAAPLTN